MPTRPGPVTRSYSTVVISIPHPPRWLRRHLASSRKLQALFVTVSLLLVTPYPLIYVVVWVRRLSLALSLVGPLFGGLSRPLSCVRGRCGAPLALESLGALALPDD